MKIKEVETCLNISRANIRFYERQGLLKPARQENRYRDYDAEDLRCLKRIMVLRKCGVPVADIKSMMEGSSTMDAVLELVLFLLCGGVVFLLAGDSFSEGIIGSVCILLVLSALAIPVFTLRRRGKDAAAKRYQKVVFGIAALILICAVVLLIVSLLNARFHFWF